MCWITGLLYQRVWRNGVTQIIGKKRPINGNNIFQIVEMVYMTQKLKHTENLSICLDISQMTKSKQEMGFKK